MDSNRYRPTDNLGINKTSKSIRKNPLHQPTFPNPKPPPPPQPQPQVYNISKSDFRSVVQQLTGTPTRDASPSSNPPNPPATTRLHKVRPPPLASIPPVPQPNPNFYRRPALPPAAAPPAQPPAAPFSPLLPLTPPPGSAFWANTQESPISAYMRYLEGSILNDGFQLSPQQKGQLQQMRPHHISSRPPPPPSPLQQVRPQVAGPPDHVAVPFPSPRAVGNLFPTPPGLLPSPTSQFLLPSPSAFLNFLSPQSPFPLLSPRLPMTPSFPFSPLGLQQGLLGLGPPLPPPSPGFPVFPLSPSGFVPAVSPRWREL